MIQDQQEAIEDALGVSAEHDRKVVRDFRHNAAVGILFEATWAVGMSFAIIAVLVPAYLGELASPRALIGFASAIGVMTVPLQLFSERLAGGRNRTRSLWLLFSGCGLAYCLMGFVGLMMARTGTRNIMIGLFIAMAAIFFICNHLGSPTYQAVLTDNCPQYRRGRLFGFRAITLGSVGLIGMVPARLILSHFSPLQAYHVAMLIAGGCFLLSSMCVLLFRDHLDPSRLESGERPCGVGEMASEAAKLIRGLWNTPNYRVFIYFAMILAGASTIAPFMITSSRDLLESAPVAPHYFQIVFLIASVLNGLFVGTFADRLGYKAILALQGLMAMVAFVVAQCAGDFATMVLSYGLLSCMSMGLPAVVCNLSVELMPRISPAHLIAAANVIFLPIMVLLPWMGGWVIDLARSGGDPAWGYRVIFTIGVTLAALGCLGTLILVQEPRSGRVYVIKVLERV